ncbi:MAG: efflux RND transporter permease subunit [Verrucomicrobiales bacterium]|nr:efflux RND transporter permease subunit [Verrucomicrobiales bacterium]
MAKLLFENPRLLLLVVGVIAVAGFSSYTTLPQMEDPPLTERFGVVRTVLPGANAERIESQITQPLEDGIRTVSGIKEVFSESMAGISTISVELEERITDVDTVWSRVRDELSEVAKSLPEGSFEPDFRQPELKAYASILGIRPTRNSEEVNLAILNRIGEELAQVIRGVSGTESVLVYGAPEEEILVEFSTQVLDGLGLTVADVAKQIEASEAKASAGIFRGSENGLVIEIDEDFGTLKRVGKTPIRYGQRGQLVELSEIADLRKAFAAPPESHALVDGTTAIVLGVFVEDDYRIDKWASNLQADLEMFQESLPAGVEITEIFSQDRYVTERLGQLGWNLLLATGAVVGVIFLLMGWRSMIVVGAALPLSALIVITGMRFLGIPIHQMSVTGLIIALGLLIDNAIVIVDEVRAAMRSGKTPARAITDTIKHLALPLFGSTLTTTFAFMPIAILPGSSGEFVGSIAVSVILAINASFLLAMTVVPALTALVQPRRKNGQKSGFWAYGFNSEPLARVYRWSLVHLLRFPVIGILLGVSLPILGFYKSSELSEQFFPPTDRDQFRIELELPASSSLEETERFAQEMREVILENESVSRVHWFLGESAPIFFYNVIPRRKHSPFYGEAYVELKPEMNSRQVIRELQETLDEQFSEARILVRQLEQGPAFDAPVEVQLYGPDLAKLQQLGSEIRLLLTETVEVVHTRADLSESVPKLALRVDEWEARMAGLSHQELSQQLYTSLEGMEAGTLIEVTEELPIRVKLKEEVRSDANAISSLQIRALGPRGRSAQGTPLSAISSFELGSDASAILRRDGERVNEIKAYVTAGVLPDVVITDFRERLDASDFVLPVGYSMEFGGEAKKRDEAVGDLMANVGLLIALMIATLVSAFRSFRAAMIIAIVGGLSIGLGLLAIWLFDFPYGFMGVVGTMGLVGVAVNDAIVVLAGIRDSEAAKWGNIEELADIIVRRTRHIVATSLTTMVGFIPLIMSGGGFWPPVAITIAGGVAGATLLALFFVPCLYLVIFGKAAMPVEQTIPPKKSARRKRASGKKTARKRTGTTKKASNPKKKA